MERTTKANIIGQIYEHSNSDLLKLFLSLMEALIDENRVKIDTARIDEIPKIQGRILQLKELKDMFEKSPILKK
jgi:hypothetical protein